MVPIPALLGWRIDEADKQERELLEFLRDTRLLQCKRVFLERGLRLRGKVTSKGNATLMAGMLPITIRFLTQI